MDLKTYPNNMAKEQKLELHAQKESDDIKGHK